MGALGGICLGPSMALAMAVLAGDSGHDATQQVLALAPRDPMCGPSCLWQAAHLLGREASLATIASLAGMDPHKGTSIQGLVSAARRLGLRAQAVRTNLAAVKDDPRIAILLLDAEEGFHFVLLDRVADRDVTIIDGPLKKSLGRAELEAVWPGHAIMVWKDGIAAANGQASLPWGFWVRLLGIALVVGASAFAATVLLGARRRKRQSGAVGAGSLRP